MQLQGSCHCGTVRFSVRAPSPYPYMACYCSICRKTAGGGGYAVNLGADYNTLQVEGKEAIRIYNARIPDPEDPGTIIASEGQRHFCGRCGSALWVYDPRWPDLVHPFASAIDTPLPKPPERVRIMLDFAAPWCEIPSGESERHFPRYPEESLAEWHRRHGIYEG